MIYPFPIYMATIDEELGQLEKDIRVLKIEYEQFFGRGRSRPPSDTQWRVETMVKRYADRGGEMSFAQRFRYNNLASNYAKYQDMWRKKLKQKEEATEHRHFGAAARAIAEQRAARGRPAKAPATFALSISNPEREGEKIERLYRELVKAREQAGEKADAPTLADFGRFVQRKTQELKKKKGCGAVEYKVAMEDGRVRLKARTGD